jgi:hypothetical protein
MAKQGFHVESIRHLPICIGHSRISKCMFHPPLLQRNVDRVTCPDSGPQNGYSGTRTRIFAVLKSIRSRPSRQPKSGDRQTRLDERDQSLHLAVVGIYWPYSIANDGLDAILSSRTHLQEFGANIPHQGVTAVSWICTPHL